MSLFQKLSEFFQSLFMSSNPEVKKRQGIRKLENELKEIAPHLYKNSLIQVNFAEALRVLFENTKVIDNLLSETIHTTDKERNKHYEEQLLITGFNQEQQEILDSLSYENRKASALEAKSLNRHFEAEYRKLETLIKAMNEVEFIKIDLVLDKIKQLNDICKFQYLNTLRLFDPNFSTNQNYNPDFQPLPPDLLETALLDLYYVISDMDISNSVFKALSALLVIKNHSIVNERQIAGLKDNLKKIQGITKHILTKNVLTLMIRIAKKDLEYVPQKANYKSNARKRYAEYLEKKFIVDQDRLKTEIQDETIINEVNDLFNDTNLLTLKGYNQDLNNLLKHSTPCSFLWVFPMQILKTFISEYYEKHVKPLLNDIVIEGFFNNPVYKKDFSSTVFACNESLEKIKEFELLFDRSNDFNEANISGLIHDSHKDAAFESTLRGLVEKINKTAKNLIQSETNNIYSLYKLIKDIVVESKKPSSDVITNLKVLMISSRNRDNSEKLDSQHSQWKVFLDIMKNYVIIGNVEKR